MQTTLDLTPSTTAMRVLLRTKDVVFVRLPLELQRDCGGCSCVHCKANPALAKWDTLAVPTASPKPEDRHRDFTYVVHMPEPSVDGYRLYHKVRRTLA